MILSRRAKFYLSAALAVAFAMALYAANRYDNYRSCELWTDAYPEHQAKCRL